MVLVDTSVWIRFLGGVSPFVTQMNTLLDRDRVAGHPWVYGELLIGDPGGRQKFLSRYERMLQASLIPHADVVDLVVSHRLRGRGLGWIDAHLLASALVNRMDLWTIDMRFAAITSEFGIAHRVHIA